MELVFSLLLGQVPGAPPRLLQVLVDLGHGGEEVDLGRGHRGRVGPGESDGGEVLPAGHRALLTAEPSAQGRSLRGLQHVLSHAARPSSQLRSASVCLLLDLLVRLCGAPSDADHLPQLVRLLPGLHAGLGPLPDGLVPADPSLLGLGPGQWLHTAHAAVEVFPFDPGNRS